MRGVVDAALRRLGWTACLGAVVLFAPGSAQAVLIDSFNQTFQEVSASEPGSSVREVVAAPEAIGGFRDVLLEIQSNEFFSPGDPTSPDMTVTINPGGSGLALYSEDSGVNGRLTLTYDGNADPGLQFPGFGPVDFTAAGIPGIVLRANSDRDFTAKFIVYSNATNFSEMELLIPGDPDPAQREFFFPFAGFTGDADFTSVQAVQLILDGILGRTDIDIDNVETRAIIPEPGSLALLGMGALGLLGVGWRRRKPNPVA